VGNRRDRCRTAAGATSARAPRRLSQRPAARRPRPGSRRRHAAPSSGVHAAVVLVRRTAPRRSGAAQPNRRPGAAIPVLAIPVLAIPVLGNLSPLPPKLPGSDFSAVAARGERRGPIRPNRRRWPTPGDRRTLCATARGGLVRTTPCAGRQGRYRPCRRQTVVGLRRLERSEKGRPPASRRRPALPQPRLPMG
jgi:hypothetical protein